MARMAEDVLLSVVCVFWFLAHYDNLLLGGILTIKRTARELF